MPGDNGAALLHYLKKEHPEIIVVAMSADPADEIVARDFRADAFLAKPFALKDLFQIVQRFVVDDLPAHLT
ncbi:MAG: response regulator, partial [Desulfobacteraceae bacterium]|nr:response regulator [Desulfobacteraceae bacterium]